MMVKRGILYVLIFLILSSCTKNNDPVLVRVDGQELRQSDIDRQFKFSQQYRRAEKITPQVVIDYIKATALDEMLFQAEGYARGYDQDSLVQARIEQEKRRILTQRKGPLYDRMVPSQFPVTEAEIQRVYEQLDKRLTIALILVRSVETADSAYQELLQGKDFSEVAARYSLEKRVDETGGQLSRQVSYGALGGELDSVAFSLDVGEFSKPVQSQFGYHIFKVLDKTPRDQVPTLEESRDRILQKLQERKRIKTVQDLMAKMFEEFDVQFHRENIDIILSIYEQQGTDRLLQAERLSAAEKNRLLVAWADTQLTVVDFVGQYQIPPAGMRPPLDGKEYVMDVLNGMVSQDVLYRKAIDMGLDEDAFYRQQIDDMIDRTVAAFTRKVMVYDRIHVTPADIERAYQAHPDRYSAPLENVQEMVENQVRSEKIAQRSRAVLQELKNKHMLDYRMNALENYAREMNEEKQR